MKKISLILCLGFIISMLFMGCNKPANSREVKPNDINKNPSQINITNEKSLSWLKLGIKDSDVLQSLNEPEEKSEAAVWGADGLEHQAWYYTKDGIELDMVKEGNNQFVNMISISAPSIYRTDKNIGIGSTKDEVINVYKNQINKEESELYQDFIVVGSIYGGTMFSFENNIVNNIFIGAVAE